MPSTVMKLYVTIKGQFSDLLFSNIYMGRTRQDGEFYPFALGCFDNFQFSNYSIFQSSQSFYLCHKSCFIGYGSLGMGGS